MDYQSLNKKNRIKNIFENMEYDKQAKDSCELATAWMKKYDNKFQSTLNISKKEVVLSSDDQIKFGVNEVNDDDIKVLGDIAFNVHIQLACGSTANKGIPQMKLLNKLVSEIENNSTLICELELKIRNIFMKDSKASLTTFIEYFQYYAGWTSAIDTELQQNKCYHLCVFSLSKSTPLALIGMLLAPCLTLYNTIILSVEKELIPLCFLIKELCNNAGLRQDRIYIVNGSLQSILRDNQVTKIVYIGDLFDKKFTELEICEATCVTTLHLGKSAMIIFDTSDLDSAVESVIDKALSYKGLYPWSVNKVLVQESVFETFQRKFEKKYKSLGISQTACYKNGDIAKDSLPEIKFGYKNAGSNIISCEQNNDLNILSFRTANEAVSLANNTRLGFAVSIWTEKINLAYEVAAKLKVGIIWINNHGFFNPACTFTPYKKSGNGYIGGIEGMMEYMTGRKTDSSVNIPKKNLYLYYGGGIKKSGKAEAPNKEDIINIVDGAVKGQDSWNKLGAKNRAVQLRKFAENCSSLQKCEEIVKSLYKWSIISHSTPSVNLGSPTLTAIKEPLGVVVIDYSDLINFELIIAAIACGNSVIIINYSKDEDFLKEICGKCTLPSGVFNVISCENNEIINSLTAHQEVSTVFASKNSVEMVKICTLVKTKKLLYLNYSKGNLFNEVTKTKCIWNSVGESFL